MTAEQLAAAAGVLLALAFNYIPGLNTWFDGLSAQGKQLTMLGLMVLVALVVFGLSCAKLGSFNVECTVQGAYGLLTVLAAAVTGNVVGYKATNYIGKKEATA